MYILNIYIAFVLDDDIDVCRFISLHQTKENYMVVCEI